MTLAVVSSLHWLLWERVLMMGSGQMGQISQEREHVCGLRWRRAVGVTCSLYILSWATSNRRVVSLGAVCNDHRDTKNARHITARKYLWHNYVVVEMSGESIPIRLFLNGYDLTPTMRDINKKFSVRYYLNLVLVDEEDRRYFKQQVLAAIWCFYRATRMYSVDYAVARCLYICHSPVLSLNGYTYPHSFSPLGSPTILVFPYQMGCQYSDEEPPNGDVGG